MIRAFTAARLRGCAPDLLRAAVTRTVRAIDIVIVIVTRGRGLSRFATLACVTKTHHTHTTCMACIAALRQLGVGVWLE